MLKSGGQLTDSLDEYVEKDMTYSYRLGKENVDAIPVSFYSATLPVKPGADGGSEVIEVLGRLVSERGAPLYLTTTAAARSSGWGDSIAPTPATSRRRRRTTKLPSPP